MDPITEFNSRNAEFIKNISEDEQLQRASRDFFSAVNKHEYSYHFTWLGRPIIQYPQDMVALQEIIWKIKPQLIIETGIAHGGSLILSSSLLELIGGDSKVVGVDIDIRAHNRLALEKHPMFKRITLLEGSSIAPDIVKKVYDIAEGKAPVVVILDSNHTHDHVLQEMQHYAPLVGKNSYLIVMDTVIEDLPLEVFADRPWRPGNSPKTAVWEFLKQNTRFEVDREIQNKLLLTVAPDGYLKCIAD